MTAVPRHRTPPSRRAGRLLRRPWVSAADRERGTIAFVMLVMMVGMALGALVVPMIVGQSHSTQKDQSRVRALHAAESGIDVALGQVRSATGPDGLGDTTKLPCGPLAGQVSGANAASYQVSIAYYVDNPVSLPGSNEMICRSGYGTYDPGDATYIPNYVLLTATGTDGAGKSAATRTVQSTYVVKTTNSNIVGGQIRIYTTGTQQYCMDAGPNPGVGSAIKLQPCSATKPPSAQQVWIYNSKLYLQLASTVGDTSVNQGLGLCISAGSANTAHTAGLQMQLVNCNAGDPLWYLQWGVDGWAAFEGSKPDQSDLDGNCINVDQQVPGQAVTLAGCASNSISNTHQTWVPSPDVGMGASAPPNPIPAGWLASQHQMVNYQQFGRCLDVTNGKAVSTGTAVDQIGGDQYLILYPCKQKPSGKVDSNQLWSYNSQGRWVSLDGTYCLRSPGVAGSHVTVIKCASDGTADIKWTNNGTQDSDGNELPYAEKYTVQDSNGMCLSIGASNDLHNLNFSKAVVEPCDGSAAQKWNAQPNLQTPMLQNTIEK